MVACVEQPAKMTKYIHAHLECLRKQPQEKQTVKLWETMHAQMDCVIMYL